MDAVIIALRGNEYSQARAKQCIESADIDIEVFDAIGKDRAREVMQTHGLKWTWANNNTAAATCPLSGLKQHPYGQLEAKIGCSMSHYLLWRRCAQIGKPMLILEHDAVFVRPLPDVDFNGICMINDPSGATPLGDYWSDMMAARGPGLFPKTRVMPKGKPDGLAGNSAYMIKPWAADELVEAFHKYGVWPNDATMCIQLFPYLEELYPFVTTVNQSISTTTC